MNIFRKLLVFSLCLVATGLLPPMVECKEAAPPEIELVGEVIKKSELPDPSTAAYPDCLAFFKFKVIKVTKGKFDNAEALVAMWGFRGYTLSEPGKFKIGDKIKLQLVPYTKVENELSGIMRVDDTQDYDSELYWAPVWEVQGKEQEKVAVVDTTIHKEKDTAKRDVVGKILRVLNAHSGEQIGGPESRMLFGDYSYLTTDNFWEKPAVKKNVRQIGILDAILEFNEYLKARSIQLVVVIPPSPVAIYPELAANVDYNFDRDGRVDSNFLKFKSELDGRNIFCVDILPDLIRHKWFKGPDNQIYPLYHENDIHWNGLGAAIAGKAVATAIRQADWFKVIAEGYPSKTVNYQVSFRSETRTSENGSFTKDHPEWKFPPSRHLRQQITPELSSAFITSSQDPNAPVWILGDSFALYAEFYQNISAGVGLPYNLIAYGGASPTADREEFTRVKDTSNIKLVIWEISYPFLASGARDFWKQVNHKANTSCALGNKLAEAEINSDKVFFDSITLFGITHDGIRLPKLTDAAGNAAPVTIAWKRVKLGKKPILTTEIGLELSGAAKSDGVAYQIVVEGKVVASQILDGHTKPNLKHYWTQTWDVDLSDYAGKTVELQLKVDPRLNWDGELAFWGNPTIADGSI